MSVITSNVTAIWSSNWKFSEIFVKSFRIAQNIPVILHVYCRNVAKLLQYCQNILCS